MRSMETTEAAGARISLAEWAAMPEDEPGELFDGRLVEGEMPTYVHELVVAWFLTVLGNWILPRGGLVAASGVKFAIGGKTGRMPDLSVFFPGSTLPSRGGVVTSAPDIVVEVISASPRDVRRDRIEKLSDYAAFGVRHYWLVDPSVRTFEALTLATNGHYSHSVSASDGSVRGIPGCDGLEIDLGALWALVDKLPDGAAAT